MHVYRYVCINVVQACEYVCFAIHPPVLKLSSLALPSPPPHNIEKLTTPMKFVSFSIANSVS